MKKEKIKTTPPKQENTPEAITRQEALKKVSKYAAATALGTLIILSPKKSQAGSGTPIPGW